MATTNQTTVAGQHISSKPTIKPIITTSTSLEEDKQSLNGLEKQECQPVLFGSESLSKGGPLSRQSLSPENTVKDCALSLAEAAEIVYRIYPRHVGKRAAIRAIRNAMSRLAGGEFNEKPMLWQEVYKFLTTKTKQYASSPAGNRESLTPYPSTFFNQSRYLDHEIEWFRTTPQEERDLRNQAEANVGVSTWRPN